MREGLPFSLALMLLLGKEERHAIFESNILETASFSKSKKTSKRRFEQRYAKAKYERE